MPKELTSKTKKEVKAVKAPVIRKVATAVKTTGLNLAVYALDGHKKGTVELSKEVFGVTPNTKLMAQAVRVYLVNQRQGTASTKTRGEVELTNAKWYRQKGTGRARHGAKSAPIFVGGGTAHGPHPRPFELKMSKQMRKKALFSALSSKLGKEVVYAVDATGASGKTKEVFGLFEKLSLIAGNKKANKVLFVASDANVVRAAKNISGAIIIPAQSLNTYEVLNSNYIVFEKGAIDILGKVFLAKEGAASAK